MILPLVRLIEGGRLRQDLWETILSMSRLPFILGLDLKAMIASNHVAQRRLLALIERYGLETIRAVMEEMIALSERRLRARLRELPDGHFRAWDYIDHDGHENRLYRFSLDLTKEGETLTFDYSGCPPQAPGFINCTEAGLRGGVFTALLPILAYDIPWNEGLKRPVRIVAPPGMICTAQPPAPTGSATIAAAWLVANTAVRALSLLVGCSDRYQRESQACSSGAFSVLNLAGLNQYGEPFGAMILDPMASGEGAYAGRDGTDAHGIFMVPVPNIANVETNENFAPILYLHRRLIPDTGGPGRLRGGCSAGVAFAIHDVDRLEGVLVSHGVEVPNATGAGGGLPGSCIVHTLLRGSDLREQLAQGRLPSDLRELRGERQDLGAKPGRLQLGPHDLFQYTWQGGGGYGDPLERSPEAVMEDVHQGLVSPEAARQLYGVAINPGPPPHALDREATEELRCRKREERLASAQGGTKAERMRANNPGLKTDHGSRLLLQISEGLGLVEAEEGPRSCQCLRCGHPLGPADRNWKESAWQRSIPPSEAGPWVMLHRELELRQFLCPGCGRLLGTEVARRGEPPLWEVELKNA